MNCYLWQPTRILLSKKLARYLQKNSVAEASLSRLLRL